jgi:hypothetical protein
MGIVVVPTFGADPVTITGPGLDAKVDGLATEFNGNIDNDNIKSAAAIANSKLNLASISQNISHSGTMSHTGVVTLTKNLKLAKGADVASANALTLGTDGNYFDITGTTAITSIGTLGVGTVVRLHFDGALTLTHHADDLILPGAANITTAAGDEAEFVEYATGDWRCVDYQKASGQSVVQFIPTAANALAGSVVQTVYTTSGAVATGTGTIPFDDSAPLQNTEGNQFMTRTITPNHVDNILKITVVAYVQGNVTSAVITGSLHKDSTDAAIAAMPIMSASAGFAQEGPPMVFTHYIVAGSTSEQTFKFRAGLSSAGTVTFNGTATNQRYGGVAVSTITIEEIKVA